MKPVVECLDFGKNNFAKWANLLFFIAFAAAFVYFLDRPGNTSWYSFAGMLLFGGIWLFNIKFRIITDQDGFAISELFRQRMIAWKDIKILQYEIAHQNELKLKIVYGSRDRKCEFSVKQFNKQKMQRFFEMLNEQCDNALKNEHFIKQATGQMEGWREQLKMYK
jgi:hypothetical protein